MGAGDDYLVLGDFNLDVAASKEVFTRLGQIQKFCNVNSLAYCQFLSISIIEFCGETIMLKDIDKLLSHTQYTGQNCLFLAYPVIYHTIIYNLVKGMRLSHNLEEMLYYRLVEMQANLPHEVRLDLPTVLDIQGFMPAKYNYTNSDLGYRWEQMIDEMYGLSSVAISTGFATGHMQLNPKIIRFGSRPKNLMNNVDSFEQVS